MQDEHIGPYRVIRLIGQGGMGAVYEGVHMAIERRVAIKILHPEFARNRDFTDRFFNEARAVNRVDHPGLVQISDYGKLEDGTAYIVMEYLKGETLGERYRRMSGHMPAAQVLQLMRQVASALAAAHDKSIIHLDLKPDNVMIVPDPETPGGERTKLLDFGIAKLAGESPSQSTNAPVGTPMYMSPEQCVGSQDLDGKSDVYSLGVMLYQMLVGRWPFSDEGLTDIMAQHLHQEPIALQQLAPWVPDSLNELGRSLLLKDAHARPTMNQVVAQIGLLLTQSDKIVRPGLVSYGMPASSIVKYEDTDTTDSSGLRTVDASASSLPWRVVSTPSNQVLVSESASAPTVGFEPTPSKPRSASSPKERGSETTGRAAAAELSSRNSGGLAPAATGPGADALLSTAPVVPRGQQLRRRAELVGALLIISAIGLLIDGRWIRRSRPTPSQPPVTGFAPAALQPDLALSPLDLRPDSHEPAARSVRWSVQSVPPGADVIDAADDKILGQTPWQLQRPAAAGSTTLRLRLSGFAEQRLTLDTNTDSAQSVTLQRKKTERPQRRTHDDDPLPIMD